MADVALSAGMRANLLTLKDTASRLQGTQARLATGRKVNSAVDNPTNYFASETLRNRSTDLKARLDTMGQGIETIKAAQTAIDGLRKILSAMKGTAHDAIGAGSTTDRQALGRQFNEQLRQAQTIAKDAGYGGINLLQRVSKTAKTDQTFNVQFSENISKSTLVITGFNITGPTAMLTATGMFTGGVTLKIESATTAFASVQIDSAYISPSTVAAGAGQKNWMDTSYISTINGVIAKIEEFDQTLRNQAKALSSNLNIVTLREDFTKTFVNTLETGADRLTLADLNEEGANLLSLNTSQQLAVQSLSLASQANQAVLRLVS